MARTLAPWWIRLLDAWFTTGRFAEDFERKLARFVGVRCASLVNSGSSANLVAVSALTSPKLGERRLKPGDEVITVAAGFPTTVNPIIQNRLVPVFVDVTLPTYEIDVSAARSRPQRENQGSHHCAHVGQCLRSRRGHGVCPQIRSVAD